MSNSSSAVTSGVIPTSADFAPSVVFLICYSALLPVTIWRCASRQMRCRSTIQSSIFVVLRVATWSIRIYLSRVKLNVGLIVAESLLVGSANILLIETLVIEAKKLLETWVPRAVPTEWSSEGKAVHRDWLSTVTRLIDLALLASLIMGIYSATRTSAAFHGDAGALDVINDLRKGSAIVLLIIIVLCSGALFWHNSQYKLPQRPTFFLLLIGVFLCALTSFRVVTAYHVKNSGSTAAFWCAYALPELLATTAFLTVNLRDLTPVNPDKINYDRAANAEVEAGGPVSYSLQPLSVGARRDGTE